MMFGDSDELMFARRAPVSGDALAAIMDFYLVITFTNPY